MDISEFPICYFAPELTALESTYVYEELLTLEAMGYKVIPVSIRRTIGSVLNNDNLIARTYFLYERNAVLTFVKSLVAFLRIGKERSKGLHILFSDMKEIGLLKSQSWKLMYQYFVAARLVEILIEHNCQHLHVHFAHVPAQIGMYASEISGVPFTIMAHANDIFERGVLLQRKAERAIRMLTISEYNLRYLKEQGVAEEKLAVVRCGVSFDIHPPITKRAKAGAYRIGTLGRMVEKKGMDNLIDAISILKDKSYDIELSIAGDGPLLEDLQQQVANLELSESVCFIGSLAHNNVKDWMQKLDIFILACKKDSNGDMDGIPVVLMEAMSQFIPVISTRLSGIPELVVHEKTGLLAEEDDPEDLASKLDRLILNPGLCEKLTVDAALHLQNEFGQIVNVKRLLKHFAIHNT